MNEKGEKQALPNDFFNLNVKHEVSLCRADVLAIISLATVVVMFVESKQGGGGGPTQFFSFNMFCPNAT